MKWLRHAQIVNFQGRQEPSSKERPASQEQDIHEEKGRVREGDAGSTIYV